MLEHVSVPVKSFERSKAFYLAVLQPLGYVLQRAYPPEAAGFMEGNHTSFWISRRRKIAKIHVAFLAKNRKEVQGFYEAAIETGGKDNGKPGRGRAMAMRRLSSIPTVTTSKPSISRRETIDGRLHITCIGACEGGAAITSPR